MNDCDPDRSGWGLRKIDRNLVCASCGRCDGEKDPKTFRLTSVCISPMTGCSHNICYSCLNYPFTCPICDVMNSSELISAELGLDPVALSDWALVETIRRDMNLMVNLKACGLSHDGAMSVYQLSLGPRKGLEIIKDSEYLALLLYYAPHRRMVLGRMGRFGYENWIELEPGCFTVNRTEDYYLTTVAIANCILTVKEISELAASKAETATKGQVTDDERDWEKHLCH